MAQQTDVPKLYKQVVEDVINNVREAFLDESVDEQVLLELRQLWENKIKQTKAVEEPSPELVSTFNTHMATLQQRHIVHGQQQIIRQPMPQPRPTAVINKQTGQIPVYNPATGTIGLSGAAQAATVALPSALYQQQLQLQPTIITGPDGTQYILPAQTGLVPGLSIVSNSTTAAPTVIPQQLSNAQVVTAPSQPQQVQVAAQPAQNVQQIDGTNDSSSEEDFDEENNDDDDDDDDNDENDDKDEIQGEEEEPLNSGDDVSDEDPSDLFDTENVVVCQFDKINRIKNKWKFNLKDGIMNLNGKDYVFSKGNGEAEW